MTILPFLFALTIRSLDIIQLSILSTIQMSSDPNHSARRNASLRDWRRRNSEVVYAKQRDYRRRTSDNFNATRRASYNGHADMSNATRRITLQTENGCLCMVCSV